MTKVLASAPGRVNLIGDHTDYTGGLVMPMAIDRVTKVEFERGVPWVELVSADEDDPAVLVMGEPIEPGAVQPPWARFVAGVLYVLQPEQGGVGFVHTELPIGAGLASSAALEVALALAFGFEGDHVDLALACQQAEQIASGVPCGVMDQLASVSGVEDHALLIDCTTLSVTPVLLPGDAAVFVVDSGTRRSLSNSFYGVRRAQCEEAEAIIGPLRDARVGDVDAIDEEDLRRRARHVVTENARVRDFAAAVRECDLASAGELMSASHASLRDDFEVSTRVLDALVAELVAQPGVYGARLTGAGFGGCVVALADPDADLDGWRVRASAGASIVDVTD